MHVISISWHAPLTLLSPSYLFITVIFTLTGTMCNMSLLLSLILSSFFFFLLLSSYSSYSSSSFFFFCFYSLSSICHDHFIVAICFIISNTFHQITPAVNSPFGDSACPRSSTCQVPSPPRPGGQRLRPQRCRQRRSRIWFRWDANIGNTAGKTWGSVFLYWNICVYYIGTEVYMDRVIYIYI